MQVGVEVGLQRQWQQEQYIVDCTAGSTAGSTAGTVAVVGLQLVGLGVQRVMPVEAWVGHTGSEVLGA